MNTSKYKKSRSIANRLPGVRRILPTLLTLGCATLLARPALAETYYWDTGSASADGTWSFAEEGFDYFSLLQAGGNRTAVTTEATDALIFSASSVTEGGTISILGGQSIGNVTINQTNSLTFAGDSLRAGRITLSADSKVSFTNEINFAGATVNAGAELRFSGGGNLRGTSTTTQLQGAGSIIFETGSYTMANNERWGAKEIIFEGDSSLATGGSFTIGNGGQVIYQSTGTSTFGSSTGVFAIGRSDQGGSGSFIVKSGTVRTTNTSRINIARGGSVSGLLEVEGGTVSVGGAIAINFDSSGKAEFYLKGGTVSAKGLLFGSGEQAKGEGHFFMSGGSLYLGSEGIRGSALMQRTIAISGGTIGANENWETDLELLLSGQTNTITFNAGDLSGNALDIELNGGLTGSASINKTGGGKLILNGAKNYFGSTTVSEGELVVNDTLQTSGINVQGGVLGGKGTIVKTVAVNNGTIKGDGLSVLAATFSGTSSITGRSSTSNGYTITSGTTKIDTEGEVNGSIEVQNGAAVNGNGYVRELVMNGTMSGNLLIGTLSGSGEVNIGNSPGIVTVDNLNVDHSLDFNFELTAYNPSYNGIGNRNDLFHITGSYKNLSSESNVNFYFSPYNSALEEQLFIGSFFLDAGGDVVTFLGDANTSFFLLDGDGQMNYSGNSVLYNDLYYSLLTEDAVSMFTTTVPQANFATGDVFNGTTLQFIVPTTIPEPGFYVMLLSSIAFLPLVNRWRRTS